MLGNFWVRLVVVVVALSCFIVALPGCENILGPAEEQEIILQDNATSAAVVLRESYGKILDVVRNPGKELKITFGSGSGAQGVRTIRLSMVENRSADYAHIRVVRDDGAVANLLWGVKSFLPSVKFADDRGRTLLMNGVPIEFGISDIVGVSLSPKALHAADWTDLAIKAFAIALVVWIGASIGKVVLAAIAFIALSAMAIALLVIAYEALSPLLRGVLGATGWDLDSLRAFFERSIPEVTQTLRDIRDLIADTPRPRPAP